MKYLYKSLYRPLTKGVVSLSIDELPIKEDVLLYDSDTEVLLDSGETIVVRTLKLT